VLNLLYVLLFVQLYQKALRSFGDNDKNVHIYHPFSSLASPSKE
jgi:hypothetical protein